MWPWLADQLALAVGLIKYIPMFRPSFACLRHERPKIIVEILQIERHRVTEYWPGELLAGHESIEA